MEYTFDRKHNAMPTLIANRFVCGSCINFIHPSSMTASPFAACPSCLRVKAGLHPGLVDSLGRQAAVHTHSVQGSHFASDTWRPCSLHYETQPPCCTTAPPRRPVPFNTAKNKRIYISSSIKGAHSPRFYFIL